MEVRTTMPDTVVGAKMPRMSTSMYTAEDTAAMVGAADSASVSAGAGVIHTMVMDILTTAGAGVILTMDIPTTVITVIPITDMVIPITDMVITVMDAMATIKAEGAITVQVRMLSLIIMPEADPIRAPQKSVPTPVREPIAEDPISTIAHPRLRGALTGRVLLPVVAE